MARIHDKNKSSLLIGIEKVMDRQNSKNALHSIDIGMFTYITYKNKNAVDCSGLWASRYALQWQPLRYVIKKVAHTHYTYEISKLPMGVQALKTMKRKRQLTKQY